MQSAKVEGYEPNENFVRSETPISGYILKKVNSSLTKLTYCGEIDFKLSLFIAKNVATKSGHLA